MNCFGVGMPMCRVRGEGCAAAKRGFLSVGVAPGSVSPPGAIVSRVATWAPHEEGARDDW
jgi:hypothetical protein